MKNLILIILVLAVLVGGYLLITPKNEQNDPKGQADYVAISLSEDKKRIMAEEDILISIDDGAIFNFFKNESELCNESNINNTEERASFCIDKEVFESKTRFKSIVSSPEKDVVGFTIESDELSPDTAVGIFYPSREMNSVRFLTNYYLGNEFLGFSPVGSSFVYKGGCFEARCAFYIKNSETLEDRIDFIPEEPDARGSYKFARWISENEIEYIFEGEVKNALLKTI